MLHTPAERLGEDRGQGQRRKRYVRGKETYPEDSTGYGESVHPNADDGDDSNDVGYAAWAAL